MNCRIYIATHKEISTINVEGYVPLLVGADRNNTFLNTYVKDNEGENISGKNDSYCELTGLYWVWKNVDYENVGLIHYRRVFANVIPHIKILGRFFVIRSGHRPYYTPLGLSEISRILSQYDIIVKRSEYRRRTNKTLLTEQIGEECVQQLCKAVKEMEPGYIKELDALLKKHTHINCNMFIGKKNITDKYCAWLFPILAYIDKNHEQEKGERYCNRELGYMGEILFGVWLNYNCVRYKCNDVVYTEESMSVNSVHKLSELFVFIREKFLARLKRYVQN